MKKIPLNAARLQLKLETIAALDTDGLAGAQGGGGPQPITSLCTQPSVLSPRYVRTVFVGWEMICDQPPASGVLC